MLSTHKSVPVAAGPDQILIAGAAAGVDVNAGRAADLLVRWRADLPYQTAAAAAGNQIDLGNEGRTRVAAFNFIAGEGETTVCCCPAGSYSNRAPKPTPAAAVMACVSEVQAGRSNYLPPEVADAVALISHSAPGVLLRTTIGL